MKKIVFLFVISLSIVTQIKVQAQNSIVSLSLNYVSFAGGPPSAPIPLPAPGGQTTLFDNYDGSPAQFNHNIMQDKDGKLLFFVVDGK